MKKEFTGVGNGSNRVYPEISRNIVFLGSHDGGWTICPDDIDESSVVYSFGVGEDITFDLSMIERFGAEVFAFDPTPRSKEYIENFDLPRQLHFFDYGIYDCDASIPLYPPKNPKYVDFSIIPKTRISDSIDLPMKRLRTIVDELGHEKIDILKMNIEAAEYKVIPDIAELIGEGFRIDQILIEFHHHRFKELEFSDTQEMLSILNGLGYRIFSNRGYERISFINLS